MQEVKACQQAAVEALTQAQTLAELTIWHQNYLSKSGEVAKLKKRIRDVKAEDKKTFGQEVNALHETLAKQFQLRQEQIKLAEMAARIEAEKIDVTLPSRPRRKGGHHPLSLIQRRVIEIFSGMGFGVYESRHVETDEVNFQLLNIPKHHPARDMQDTFFVSDDVVLRTHTSTGQVHAMREFAPGPLQIISPGLCYRFEDITPRSEIQFHQVEGLLIGPDVKFSDLKGVLLNFARQLFGKDQKIRMRGSYFPFTEPSVEVDILCTLCGGDGCRVCKHSGWLELLGAGLVHPNVLRHGGYDPEKMRGIAFGMGLERVVLLQHCIDDIRYFFRNDLRFLKQFN